jgi:hypothetical protein
MQLTFLGIIHHHLRYLDLLQFIRVVIRSYLQGHFVKYIWYVSIAAQHVDAPIKMVQLPIKILNTTVNIGMSQPSISNPFLLEEWQRERCDCLKYNGLMTDLKLGHL